MNGLALALGASLAWGVADFVGPWQGRTLGALRVMLWEQVAGLVAILIVAAATGRLPHDAVILLAIPAALSGTLGLYAFYRGMALGAMAVVAPIAGASAIIPVIFGIASGDRPSTLQYLGVACALVGVVLAAQERQEGAQRKVAAGVGLALIAAVGFGFYFPPMHAAGEADPVWASVVFRTTACFAVAAVVGLRRPVVRLGGWKLLVILGVGIGDTLGNGLYAASASSGGEVSLASVLASLYPIVTVLLAALVLGERLALWQALGVALTLAGVGLIAY